MSQPAHGDAALVRAIGLRQLTAAIVNTTVGAGIFVLPALVAQTVGAAAPLAFLVCGAMMVLIVMAMAMAGSRVTITGGLYAYAVVAFGPFAGFIAGVLIWLTGILAVSGVSSALLDQASTLAPALQTGPFRVAVLVIIFGLLALVNVRGVTAGVRIIEGVTVAKLLPLLVFVCAGLFFLEPGNLSWPGMPESTDLRRAVLLLIFAFTGAEVALAPSGEMKNSSRTVPAALALALVVTTTLYIAIQIVAQGVLGADLSRYPTAPLAEATSRFLGNAGRTLLLLGAVCSMFGYVCGDMLSSPRNLFGIARDGLLPSTLMRVHPLYRTPFVAIWLHATLAVIFASTSSFQSLAIIANVATLLLYLLCCAAALELARRDVRGDGPPFNPPGAWLAPLAGGGMVAWILYSATAAEFRITGWVLAVATLLYLTRRLATTYAR